MRPGSARRGITRKRDERNKDTAEYADLPNFVVLGTKLYVLWSEAGQIRARVFNGDDVAPAWTFVDGNGVSGINKDPEMWAYNVRATVLADVLYATWTEYNGIRDQVRVAAYNGNDQAPAWTFVDGAGADGLNKDPAEYAYDSRPAALGSKLYLIWSEFNGTGYQTRITRGK